MQRTLFNRSENGSSKQSATIRSPPASSGVLGGARERPAFAERLRSGMQAGSACGHTSHAAMQSLAGQALSEIRTRHSGRVVESPLVTWSIYHQSSRQNMAFKVKIPLFFA